MSGHGKIGVLLSEGGFNLSIKPFPVTEKLEK